MKRLIVGVVLIVLLAAVAVAVMMIRRAPSAERPGDSAATSQPRSGEAAVQPGAPGIALRLNGLAPGPEPFVLTPGEPIMVEIQLRHPDRRATEPIRLEPPSGSWAERAKVVVTDGGGGAVAWPFMVTGKPSAGALALQPAAVTTLVLRMEKAASAAVVPGSYRLIARLDLGDGRGFRGTVDSEPADVSVIAAPSAPVGAGLGRRQLLRVRDALLCGDVAAADQAATEMQRAEPRRPEGFVGMALVHEARGERSRAILSTQIAISRVLDGGGLEPVSANDKPRPEQPRQTLPPKSIPVEYYELLGRLERMPPEPSGRSK